jgi:hypothetical protein
MTHDNELAKMTRTAVKVGLCVILVLQVLGYGYLCYLHKGGVLVPIDPRIAPLAVAAFIYMMAGTSVPEVLKKSAGIRRQAIHFTDWMLAFGIWQYVAGVGLAALVALLAVGSLLAVSSVKDALQLEA